VDGHIVAAAQEERFTRKKHDSRFPSNAVRYCLEECGIKLEQVDQDADSPYMLLLVADFVKARRRAMTSEEDALFGIDKLNVARSEIPAVTHVDHSARLQTVHRETNPRYHALLSVFKAKTGWPVLPVRATARS
jgi:predicted NodU family carbamoyl transferase